MRIANVQPFLMSYPMPEEIVLPFWGGRRTILKRDAMLIKVTTDTGLTGWAPGPAHGRASHEIAELIKPFLLGKDPLQWRSLHFRHSPDVEKTYHAVEVALLDLVARYERCAVSELMGGRKRDRIKLYGSAGMYMPPEAYAEEAFAVREKGFRAYNMRPALGPDEDIRTVQLMREATGNDMGLMIDAHTWWRMGDRSYPPEVISDLATELSKYNPYWLEEPLPPEDHDAYRALRGAIQIPLASGEHEQDLEGFHDLARTRAVDFLQMDVCCQGGFEMGLKVFDLAAENNLRFAFHSWGNTFEVLVAAHLGICRDESVVEWLEYPCYSAPGRKGMYPFPLSDEILAERLDIRDGYLHVPSGPGWGVEVNEKVIDKYPFLPGPWSYFHQNAPRETIAVTGDHSVKWINEPR